MIRALCLVMALMAGPLVGAASAQASPQTQVNATLRQDARIHASLLAAGIAVAIAERCPAITSRDLRIRTDALGLVNHARGLGYSLSQVRAFVDDRAEKDRMRAQVRDWFAARGLRDSDPADGFCALGRQQMAENAPAARYMRAQ
jgi:hypothetical protein